VVYHRNERKKVKELWFAEFTPNLYGEV